MTTLSTMRDRIAAELVNEPITSSQIDDAIRSAIKHYERETWWFNVRIVTWSTIADVEYYESTAPDDFENVVVIQSMTVTSGSSRIKMRQVPNTLIEDVQDSTVTGQPEMFARSANKIRLYPIPSAVYTITMTHSYKLTTVTEDDDTNEWLDDCEDMIRQSAKRILAYDVLHSEDIAARCEKLETVAYGRLRSESRQRADTAARVNWPFNRRNFNATTGY
jgi:hypothetical protein